MWRRMERINWADKANNEEVMIRIKRKRTLLDTIIKRESSNV